MLTKFKAISFDGLSMIMTFISIIVTIQNTFSTFINYYGGNLMITVLLMVDQGVYEVTVQTVNGDEFVVSI